MGGPAARRVNVSKTPEGIKSAMIRDALLKKTASRRPAGRVDLAKEISEFDKKVDRLPENKKPAARKQLLGKLEARHNYILSNIKKLSQNLNRYKFNEENISFLKLLRAQELKRTNNNQYKMWDYAEQKLKARYKPVELLKAGYTVGEVTAGVFRLETKRKV